MKIVLVYFLISFGAALVFAPFVIWILKQLKAKQEILHYVEWHKTKKGTPTMGGWIFILPFAALAGFVLSGGTPLANIALLAAFAYAILGSLDDFIKIRGKKNLGLRAYQKIIGQGGIAILVGVFYFLANRDGRILIPFANTSVDIGFWILPLTILVLIATTNSVNLTDGVDGLAASVSLVYFIFAAIIIALVSKFMPVPEHKTFMTICALACGGLLCFLLFNTNRARVFMGDTGSLFLGGLIATVSMFTFLGFYLLILGIMFVISAASDIIQVAYFKMTKGKRVFLMAPFHHHLEKKGWAEAKIVFLYTAITVLAGVVCVVTLL